MCGISGFLNRNRYLASAKPPRLLSVTMTAVCVEEMKIELSSQLPKACREKSERKLSSVNEPRCGQGRNVYVNKSSPRLSEAHSSQMKGTMLSDAAAQSAR